MSRPDLPDPGPLIQLATAYWDAQTFLTANRIGLFGALAEGPLCVEALTASLGTQVRPTRLLANACVALGVLEGDATGYRNNALSTTYLVPGAQTYLGHAFRYSDDLFEVWANLEASLRSDKPALCTESYTGEDEARTRNFVHGMHNRALGIGQALVGVVDLSDRKQLLDVGGGPGTYSALFALRFPELRARVLDLPGVAAIASEILTSMGVADRVSAEVGDFHTTEFPGGNDAVLISGVFHRESEASCRDLIRRAAEALTPGGLLIVSDVFADAGGTGPPFAALFGLNMMLTAPEGGVHADADVAEWMTAVGFAGVERRPFPPPMPHRVVIGTKH